MIKEALQNKNFVMLLLVIALFCLVGVEILLK